MKIDQFDSDRRKDDNRPWRKYAAPLNKAPSDPKYPTQPFNHDEWMKSSKPMEEGSDQPVPGDSIRTPKLEGKVTKVEDGYVYFTTADGRNMRNTLENVTVVEKLADQDEEMFEDEEIDEVSTELLAKYKTAAGKSASEADKRGDFATGNKRFSGIVKATKKQFDNDAKKKVSEVTKPGLEDNFTIGDIKRLEGIKDFETLKAQAKVLVKGKADRRMKPEKISWFYNAIDGKTNAQAVIKLMYDLLLAGEGNSVIGSRNSMRQNSYRDKFGEQKAEEGTMGGINRSAPSNDVSYEKVLDEVKAKWEESQLNELSVENIQTHEDAVTNILTKQHDDQKAKQFIKPSYITIDKRWTVRYVKPAKEFEKVKWQVLDGHKNNDIAHEGVAMSSKDAVAQAQEWVGNRGVGLTPTTKNSTLDFNAKFLDQISQGNTFYAAIDEYDGRPALIYSLEPNEDLNLRKSTPRSAKTALPGVPVSAAVANKAKLTSHGRYELGPRIEYGPGIYIFPLKYDSSAESKTDRKRLQVPSFTVGTADRSVDEEYRGPWQGDAEKFAKAPKSSTQGKDDVRLSDMVQDTIREHGVKWAFDYYVHKHGMPPRQFQIFAGLTANKPKKSADPMPDQPATKGPEKQSWWKKLRGKLPFEE